LSQLPPIRTATLAQLYLAQGHVETAAEIASDLSGEDAATVHQALSDARERQVALLTALLKNVQERRRPPARETGRAG